MLGTSKTVEPSTKAREGVHTKPRRIPDDWDDWDANDPAPSLEDLSVAVKPEGLDLFGLPETQPQSHNHPPDHRISTMGKER